MTLLRVRNLRAEFATELGVASAVQGVSFDLEEGEVLGIVGESGSGKSVTALSIMRLLPEPPARITADELVFDGIELIGLTEAQAREVRGARIGMIFQDPMSSLNPVLTVGRQLTEVLRRHQRLDGAMARRRAIELLEMVGIPLPERQLGAYPHQFSGGMRQRVMIAIALSCKPKLVIADEPTTALDVTIQAQIIELVKRLTRDLGTSVIWISHDLGVIAGMCDRVNVMYAGRIVETGSVDDVFYRPGHGYTLGLMGSTPRVDGSFHDRLVPIDGSPPSLLDPTTRCPFLPRCRFAVADCEARMPPVRDFGRGHTASCFAELGAPFATTAE
ncbi:MAG: ABC transporter ATP-binding protein [Hyphomicrobiales bacterium]